MDHAVETKLKARLMQCDFEGRAKPRNTVSQFDLCLVSVMSIPTQQVLVYRISGWHAYGDFIEQVIMTDW